MNLNEYETFRNTISKAKLQILIEGHIETMSDDVCELIIDDFIDKPSIMKTILLKASPKLYHHILDHQNCTRDLFIMAFGGLVLCQDPLFNGMTLTKVRSMFENLYFNLSKYELLDYNTEKEGLFFFIPLELANGFYFTLVKNPNLEIFLDKVSKTKAVSSALYKYFLQNKQYKYLENIVKHPDCLPKVLLDVVELDKDHFKELVLEKIKPIY